MTRYSSIRAAAPLAASLLLALAASSATLGAQDTLGVRTTVAPRPLTLGDAVRLAARQSAFAEQARYRSDQAEARVRQARSGLLPDVSAAASDGQRTFNTASFGLPLPGFDPAGEVVGPVRTIDFRGRVQAPIVNLPAVGRIRSARSAARASEADASNSAEQAAQLAAVAYLRALRANEFVLARAADSVLAADLLGIAQNQLTAGVGVGLDVTRARSQLSTVRSQLIAARGERDRARLDLQRTLGLPLDEPVVLVDSLRGLAQIDTVQDEAAAIAKALRDRPDVRAADEQVAAARQQVSAIRAERLPTVGVFADDGATSNSYTHLLNTYTYGVQVSLPIFDGFRREGRVEEQSAVARELDVRRRDLRQQAAIEVRGALLDLRTARQQVDAARERLALAEQEVAQARDRFRAGVAGNADIITASLTLNNARNALIDAVTSYQNARVSFARATGSVTELP